MRFPILFLLGALLCAAAPRAPVNDAADTVANGVSIAGRMQVLDDRAFELDRRGAIDQARREIDNDANARLQNYVGLVSALIGIFALISTVLLVIIAIRTPGQAIAAAVKAAADGLEAERNKINDRLEAVENLLTQAVALVDQIRSHESTAKSIIERLRPGESPRTEAERGVVAAAAVQATSKPPANRTSDDFYAVVVDAVAKRDWAAVLQEARAMAYLYPSGADFAFAMIQQGLALVQLGKPEEGVSVYSQLIERARGDAKLQTEVATAMLNKGAAYAELRNYDEANRIYRELVDEFQGSSDRNIMQTVGFALANIAVNEGQAGRYEYAAELREDARRFMAEHPEIDFSSSALVMSNGEAAELLRQRRVAEGLDILDGLIERYGASENADHREYLGDCHYNRACAYALQGDIERTVSALGEWAQRAPVIDCQRLREDVDFDEVRELPQFVAFMAAHNCLKPGDPNR